MLIIAHRGARHLDCEVTDRKKLHRENTFPAFEEAAKAGFPFECDVHATSTGGAVIHHNPKFFSETAGIVTISRWTLHELAQAGLIGKGATQMPMLVDVLLDFAIRVPVYVELKGEGSAEATHDYLDLIRKHRDQNILERIVFSSFSIRELNVFRKLEPSASLALTMASGHDHSELFLTRYIKERNITEVHVDVKMALDGKLDWMVKKLDVAAKVFTVNSPTDAIALRNLSRPNGHALISGIFTDYPEMMNEVLADAYA